MSRSTQKSDTLRAVSHMYEYAVQWLEKILALLIFLGLISSLVYHLPVFFQADWADINAFQDIVNIVLTLIIGIEAVRLLSTYSLENVLELLAFVVARKALQPEATSLSLLFDVIAFVILIGGRYMLTCVIPKFRRSINSSAEKN